MAKSQQNSTITLLGLKNCKAEEVVSGDDRVTVKIIINGVARNVPIVAQPSSMGMVCVTLATYFTPGQTAQRFIYTCTGNVGGAAVAAIPLLKASNWYAPVPGLPGRPKPRPYGSSRIETSAR